ncbi:MAG: hypothetical protein Q4G50_13600 [Corynebacterium sp.]|uniref:hypothetical protein n=1 Tax=Corynebacterium sp. TaxID=1720 RepID=UPI0026DFE514|nr:hypothetical protein [Corynebacterium sp.]MDO5671020.1 hypothetical protein [Corynebacterium sp.]
MPLTRRNLKTKAKAYLVYRTRWRTDPMEMSLDAPYHVFCAVTLDEQVAYEMWSQGKQAGAHIAWEEIPLQGQADFPTDLYIVFQGGIPQDDPLALELSNPVGIAAFDNKDDVQDFIDQSTQWDWEDVWTVPAEWRSKFLFTPFPARVYLEYPEPNFFTA